jgi:uncharacterized protein (TIGR02246 family)
MSEGHLTREEARTLIERQALAWEHEDLQAIAADFADDAMFISPGGTWHGPVAIQGAARAFFATTTGVRVVITRIIMDGDKGAVEWTWHETRRSDGRQFSAEDGIVFVLRGRKIVYWREYFDTAAMYGSVQ